MNAIDKLAAFLAAHPAPLDVEVGRYYEVPCAWTDDTNTGLQREWWPLVGPIHEDFDVIGFRPLHVHIDTRFTEYAAAVLPRPFCLTQPDVSPDHRITFKFSLRPMQCLRQAGRWQRVSFTDRLEAKHHGCRIGPDGLCPHRGIPIAAGHRLPDGTTVCAGHGLRWAPTGELMSLADP